MYLLWNLGQHLPDAFHEDDSHQGGITHAPAKPNMQNFGLVRQRAGSATLEPIPMPQLQDDYVLVETKAVALNPTDWSTLDAFGDTGTLVGCDYGGIVVKVGKTVVRHFSKGDRIAGFGHGGMALFQLPRQQPIVIHTGTDMAIGNDANPETGAFARYVAVKGDLQMRIPDDVSFEAASSVGVGVGTVGYGLYKVLNLPWPGEDSSTVSGTILIYGGSTATGSLAIQFAKL